MGKKKKDNEALLKGVQTSIKSAQKTVKSATKSMQQSAETLRTANPKTNVANTNTTKTTQGSSVNVGGLPKLGTITRSGAESIQITPPYLSMPSAPKSTAAPSTLITAAERAGAIAQAAAQHVTQIKAQPNITLGATRKNAAAPQAANQRATRNLMFPAIGSLPLKSEAQDDKTRLIRNSALWHATKDPTEQARLKAENDSIRKRNNWTYQPGSGATMAARAGLPLSRTDNLTLPVTMQFGTAAQKTDADEAQRQMRTPEAITQARTSQKSAGERARETINRLYTTGESWTAADKERIKHAKTQLASENQAILNKYGVQVIKTKFGQAYKDAQLDALRNAGASAEDLEAFAQNETLQTQTHRARQGLGAATQSLAATPFVWQETTYQRATNVDDTRKTSNYEELEQQLAEVTLQIDNLNASGAATDFSGQMTQEAKALYDEQVRIRAEMDSTMIKTPVSQDATGQRMMQDAAQKRGNATAGLSKGKARLVNAGLSAVETAPNVALSLIPGVGPILSGAAIGAKAEART